MPGGETRRPIDRRGENWGPPERTDRHIALEELTTAVRRLVEATVATGHDGPTLRALAAEVDAVTTKAESTLDEDPWVARSSGPGILDPGAVFGINGGVGRSNPISPVMDLTVSPDHPQVTGTVRFGLAHVGPAYRAHGGMIALVLDQVLGIAAVAGGGPGLTKSITVTYKRATPIEEDVRVEASFIGADERAGFVTARLIDATGSVTAEAEARLARGRPKA